MQKFHGPFGLGDVKQHLRADNVGLHERPGAEDAAIDVTFGGEVHDLGDLVIVKSFRHRRRIADVAFDKRDAIVLQQIVQVREIPGVSELVERDELHLFAARNQHADKV